MLENTDSESQMGNGLKPCPWCGGEVCIRESNDIPPAYAVHHNCKPIDYAHTSNFFIRAAWRKTQREAAELWNNRTDIDGGR